MVQQPFEMYGEIILRHGGVWHSWPLVVIDCRLSIFRAVARPSTRLARERSGPLIAMSTFAPTSS